MTGEEKSKVESKLLLVSLSPALATENGVVRKGILPQLYKRNLREMSKGILKLDFNTQIIFNGFSF